MSMQNKNDKNGTFFYGSVALKALVNAAIKLH